MKEKIVIIGGIGNALVVAEQLMHAIKNYNYNAEFLGFVYNEPSMDEILGFPVLCHPYEDIHQKLIKYEDVKFIFQLYRPDRMKQRSELRDSFHIPIDKYTNFIHPFAYVAESAKMGKGNVLLANTVINSSAVIGNFNVFNSGVLLEHDAIVGDSNFFAGHSCIGSHTIISSRNFFGTNSTVRGNLVCGDNNLIGMGANVLKNVEDYTIVYGNPAKLKGNLDITKGCWDK